MNSSLLSNIFLYLLLSILTRSSVQFRPTKPIVGRRNVQTKMSSSDITIRVASDDEFPRCADFLSKSMYGDSISKAQQKELSRLEYQDLSKRYGALVGRRKFPTTLLVAVEDEEIVGWVMTSLHGSGICMIRRFFSCSRCFVILPHRNIMYPFHRYLLCQVCWSRLSILRKRKVQTNHNISIRCRWR
jgi:hypothetical protein